MPIASPPLRLDLPDDWQSARAVLSGKLMQYFDQLAKRGGLNVDPAEIASIPLNAWAPALMFSVPGNLVATYTQQDGGWTQYSSLIWAVFNIVTSSFTYTTSGGTFGISGLPHVSNANAARFNPSSALVWGDAIVLDAGYTSLACYVSPNSSSIGLVESGSGKPAANIIAANVPSGSLVRLRGSIWYSI